MKCLEKRIEKMLKKIIKIIGVISILIFLIVGGLLCVGGINEVVVSGKKNSLHDEGVKEFTLYGSVYKNDKYEFRTYESSPVDKVSMRVYTYKSQYFVVDEDQDMSGFINELNTEGRKKSITGCVIFLLSFIAEVIIWRKSKNK